MAMAADGTHNDSSEWLAGYVGRVTELVEEAARVNARLADQWSRRSLHDEEWTIDTVTADLIEAWEHVTPLAGQGIELWLELVQRTIRSGGSS
jgi:hypothetical protein